MLLCYVDQNGRNRRCSVQQKEAIADSPHEGVAGCLGNFGATELIWGRVQDYSCKIMIPYGTVEAVGELTYLVINHP